MITTMPAQWPAKDPAEADWATFDFAAALQAGETISAIDVAISTRTGSDASPSAVLDGAASEADGVVTQRFAGGVDGASYLLRCAATTSLSRVLVLAGVLPVRTIR